MKQNADELNLFEQFCKTQSIIEDEKEKYAAGNSSLEM